MRLIDADVITDSEIIDYLGIRYASCLTDVRDMLDEQPTIEAAPVAHGRWEWRDCKMGEPHCYCSNCNEKALHDIEGFYVESEVCPNCGANMKGGTK